MKWILIWAAYEFIRPRIIWLWYYLINKGSNYYGRLFRRNKKQTKTKPIQKNMAVVAS
jgi:hypothetical protein